MVAPLEVNRWRPSDRMQTVAKCIHEMERRLRDTRTSSEPNIGAEIKRRGRELCDATGLPQRYPSPPPALPKNLRIGKESSSRGKEEPKADIESSERVAPTTDKPAAAPPKTLSPKQNLLRRKAGQALQRCSAPPSRRLGARRPNLRQGQGRLRHDRRRPAHQGAAFHALNVQNGVLSKDWTATFYLFWFERFMAAT
jgi:hypothetical protein